MPNDMTPLERELCEALEGALHSINVVIEGYNPAMVKWLLRGRRDEIEAALQKAKDRTNDQ